MQSFSWRFSFVGISLEFGNNVQQLHAFFPCFITVCYRQLRSCTAYLNFIFDTQTKWISILHNTIKSSIQILLKNVLSSHLRVSRRQTARTGTLKQPRPPHVTITEDKKELTSHWFSGTVFQFSQKLEQLVPTVRLH